MGKLQNRYDKNDHTLYTTIETIESSSSSLEDNTLIKLIFRLDDRQEVFYFEDYALYHALGEYGGNAFLFSVWFSAIVKWIMSDMLVSNVIEKLFYKKNHPD
jgi:hypothetical protein